MPGKASVPLSRYMEAFRAAVPVFGRGQVSTYILAGLGDSREALLAMAQDLIAIGVYPFIVPFVPITGTPLESHPLPRPSSWHRYWARWRDMLAAAAGGGEGEGRLRALRRLLGAFHLREAAPARSAGGMMDLAAPPFVRPITSCAMPRRLGAGRSRRSAPCGVLREQGLFAHHDRDTIDAAPRPSSPFR
jgi:hypothetical protein